MKTHRKVPKKCHFSPFGLNCGSETAFQARISGPHFRPTFQARISGPHLRPANLHGHRACQGNILSSLLFFLKLIFPLAPFGRAAMAIKANSNRFL